MSNKLANLVIRNTLLEIKTDCKDSKGEFVKARID